MGCIHSVPLGVLLSKVLDLLEKFVPGLAALRPKPPPPLPPPPGNMSTLTNSPFFNLSNLMPGYNASYPGGVAMTMRVAGEAADFNASTLDVVRHSVAEAADVDASMVSVGAALSTLRGGEDASLASAECDMLLAEMQSHRRVLEESMPDYFRRLPLELARPSAEIQRCNCAERYVSVPKSTANGREFYGCPLWKRNRERGCSYFQWTM